MSDDVYYVRNADLIPEVKSYSETGVMSEKLGRQLMLIAKNLSNKSNFINYTWKEDMCQEAVLTCCKYLKNFDMEKSNNPFAYITTICNHAFVNYINKQKRHSEIKDKCFNHREVIMDDEMIALTNRAIDYTAIVRERGIRLSGTVVNGDDIEEAFGTFADEYNYEMDESQEE